MPTDPLDAYGSSDLLDADASAALAPLLTGSGQVQRATRPRDAAGGWSDAWAATATVACHVWASQAQAFERSPEGRVEAAQTWYAAVPVATDVTPKDRFVTGGVTFEVTDTDGGRTGAGVLVLQLRRIT